MNRVYHPINLWEEIEFNMWGDAIDRKESVRSAIEFTSNHELYGEYMMRVVSEWSFSCENAMTDSNLNRRAWVGHAATALALGFPEDVTREAWRYLTNEQRVLANNQADRAILWWEANKSEGREVHSDLERQVLLL